MAFTLLANLCEARADVIFSAFWVGVVFRYSDMISVGLSLMRDSGGGDFVLNYCIVILNLGTIYLVVS